MALIEQPKSPLVSQLQGVHFFGFDSAPCSQRVSFALAEKGLSRSKAVSFTSDAPTDVRGDDGSYVFREVSLIKQANMTEAYAEIQPHMVVPALVHNGKLHIESMDIVTYIDETWPHNRLVPEDPQAARLADELVELGKQLHVSVRYVSFHWGLGRIAKTKEASLATVRRLEQDGSPEQLADFYTRFNKDAIEDEVNLTHLQHLEAGWGAQEQRLADGRPFLTGDAFSKADIIWAIKVLRIFECGYPFKKNFPALFAWFSRIQQRPGFQAGVMKKHRTIGRAFRLKSSIENLLGMGIRKVSRAPVTAA